MRRSATPGPPVGWARAARFGAPRHPSPSTCGCPKPSGPIASSRPGYATPVVSLPPPKSLAVSSRNQRRSPNPNARATRRPSASRWWRPRTSSPGSGPTPPRSAQAIVDVADAEVRRLTETAAAEVRVLEAEAARLRSLADQCTRRRGVDRPSTDDVRRRPGTVRGLNGGTLRGVSGRRRGRQGRLGPGPSAPSRRDRRPRSGAGRDRTGHGRGDEVDDGSRRSRPVVSPSTWPPRWGSKPSPASVSRCSASSRRPTTWPVPA